MRERERVRELERTNKSTERVRKCEREGTEQTGAQRERERERE